MEKIAFCEEKKIPWMGKSWKNEQIKGQTEMNKMIHYTFALNLHNISQKTYQTAIIIEDQSKSYWKQLISSFRWCRLELLTSIRSTYTTGEYKNYMTIDESKLWHLVYFAAFLHSKFVNFSSISSFNIHHIFSCYCKVFIITHCQHQYLLHRHRHWHVHMNLIWRC